MADVFITERCFLGGAKGLFLFLPLLAHGPESSRCSQQSHNVTEGRGQH